MNNIIVLQYTLVTFMSLAIDNNYDHIKNISNLSCKVIAYLECSMLSISTWIMVIILFDRFMTIKFDKRFKFLQNFKYKSLILVSTYLAIFSIYIPVVIDYKLIHYYY